MEPTGVLHCLSCVTALKGEHATHCGEPDCSGVIDQLPGVIPRYRAAETNAGKNTLNLLSPPGSRRQGERSPFPQAKTLNTGRECSCYVLPAPSPNTCFKLSQLLWTQIFRKEYQGPASKEIQFKTETRTNQDHSRHKHCRLKTSRCTKMYLNLQIHFVNL